MTSVVQRCVWPAIWCDNGEAVQLGCLITTAVDASLIGGAVIDTGDVVIDGSLKGKLARLQSSLAH